MNEYNNEETLFFLSDHWSNQVILGVTSNDRIADWHVWL